MKYGFYCLGFCSIVNDNIIANITNTTIRKRSIFSLKKLCEPSNMYNFMYLAIVQSNYTTFSNTVTTTTIIRKFFLIYIKNDELFEHYVKSCFQYLVASFPSPQFLYSPYFCFV